MFSETSQSTLSASTTEYRYASASQLDGECARLGLDRWLGETEISQLKQWRNPHRRQDWLRGRMLAKQLIADSLGQSHDLTDISIVPEEPSPRPDVRICGERQIWSLSISHSPNGVLVALAREPEMSVGVDLTDRASLSPHFSDVWFTKEETDWIRQQPDRFAVNRHWALKESLFKACNRGEGFDPRKIEILDRRATYRGTPVTYDAHCETIENQIAVVVTVHNFHRPLNRTH